MYGTRHPGMTLAQRENGAIYMPSRPPPQFPPPAVPAAAYNSTSDYEPSDSGVKMKSNSSNGSSPPVRVQSGAGSSGVHKPYTWGILSSDQSDDSGAYAGEETAGE